MRKAFQFTLAAIAFCTISLIESCSSEEVEKCDGKLTATSETTNVTSCSPPNGSITITPTGGAAPYSFKLDNGTAQANGTFSNLAAGEYLITVTDDKGCEFEKSVTVSSSASTLNFTTTVSKAHCDSNTKGEIVVSATGGSGGYTYAIGSGEFGANNTLPNLNSGNHTVKVKDLNGCEVSKSVNVGVESSLTYNGNIKAIIDAKCATGSKCHASGGDGGAFTDFSKVSAKASSIKTRASNNSMPPSGNPDLTVTELNEIVCWVDSGAKEQ